MAAHCDIPIRACMGIHHLRLPSTLPPPLPPGFPAPFQLVGPILVFLPKEELMTFVFPCHVLLNIHFSVNNGIPQG